MTTFECPKCGEEMSAEVDVGEHIVDFSNICENPACLHRFTEDEKMAIYEAALEDGWSSMIDHAHDLLSDR